MKNTNERAYLLSRPQVILPQGLLTEFREKQNVVMDGDQLVTALCKLIMPEIGSTTGGNTSSEDLGEFLYQQLLKAVYSQTIIAYVCNRNMSPFPNRLDNQQQHVLFQNIVRHKANVGAWGRRRFFASCCPSLFKYGNRDALIEGMKNDEKTQMALDAYAQELMTDLGVEDSVRKEFPKSVTFVDKPTEYLERLEKLIYLKTQYNHTRGLYDHLVGQAQTINPILRNFKTKLSYICRKTQDLNERNFMEWGAPLPNVDDIVQQIKQSMLDKCPTIDSILECMEAVDQVYGYGCQTNTLLMAVLICCKDFNLLSKDQSSPSGEMKCRQR